MIMIITLALSILVIINFLLLRFSCNKTTKKHSPIKPTVIKAQGTPVKTTEPLTSSSQLAPTGS